MWLFHNMELRIMLANTANQLLCMHNKFVTITIKENKTPSISCDYDAVAGA